MALKISGDMSNMFLRGESTHNRSMTRRGTKHILSQIVQKLSEVNQMNIVGRKAKLRRLLIEDFLGEVEEVKEIDLA